MNPEPSTPPPTAQTTVPPALAASHSTGAPSIPTIPPPAAPESRPETVVNGVSEAAVLLLDQAGVVVAAHPSCDALFLRGRNELVGLKVSALLAPSAWRELEGILGRGNVAEGASASE